MLIQIIIIIFILIAIWRLAARFRKKEMTVLEFLAWLAFWILVGLAVAWPHATDVVAQFVGVERGFNLLVALAIILLFFLIFKIFIRVEKLNKDITEVVRRAALQEGEKSPSPPLPR